MKFLLQSLSIILLAIACNVPTKTAEIPTTLPQVMHPDADTLKIDLQKSAITWIGSKPTGKHDGFIELADGIIIINNNLIVGGKVTVDIGTLRVMDIVDSKSKEKLKTHLLSTDFFDLENYPMGYFEVMDIQSFDSTFQITDKEEFPSKYKPESASQFTTENPNIIISGMLTLRGVTKQIIFPAQMDIYTKKVSVEAKFNIDRSEWGLTYNNESSVADKLMDKFIYNTVNMGFYIEAPRK